jgi:hypothetical protein
MTAEEFNTKYDAYIERRSYTNKFAQPVEQKFDGLEFDIPDVTKFLDSIFEDLTKIPGFTYSQIKLKFNTTRFYTNLKSTSLQFTIEKQIDKLVEKFDKQQEEL